MDYENLIGPTAGQINKTIKTGVQTKLNLQNTNSNFQCQSNCCFNFQLQFQRYSVSNCIVIKVVGRKQIISGGWAFCNYPAHAARAG